MAIPLLEVKNLKKYFTLPAHPGRKSAVAKSVDGLSFHINPGETFGLVGESGCGKTITGKMIMKLLEPTAGEIFLDGREIVGMSAGKFRKMRKDIQVVFQNPNAALDPKMSIETILTEPLLLHRIVTRPYVKEEVERLLDQVALAPEIGRALPHQLSSGQKQRAAIAKAISTRPKFIICDEPVSALDVSVQSHILNLLMDLKKRLGMTYLFISHSLGVVQHVSDRVGIMYLGRMVETGTTEEVFEKPLHPYTRALLSASPIPDPTRNEERIELKGEVPLCTDVPPGCPFHPRCPEAREICRTVQPETQYVSAEHCVACHGV